MNAAFGLLDNALPIAALSILCAALVHVAVRALLKSQKTNRDSREAYSATTALLFSVLFVLFLISRIAEGAELQLLMLVVVLAAVLGLIEQRFRLTTQYSLPSRVLLSIIMVFCGYRFHSEAGGAGTAAVALASLLFHLGVFYSLNLIDRLKGLAPGVVMIIGMGLLSISLGQAPFLDSTLFLVASMTCLGLLVVMKSDDRLRIGSGGQLVLGVLLGAAAFINHTGGDLTPTAAALPLLALAVPVGEAMWRTLHRLSHGKQSDSSGRVLSILHSVGFTRRWLVFLLWIATLQIVVVANLATRAGSPLLAAGAIVSMPLVFLFLMACLNRIADRLERSGDPGKLRILFLSHYFPPEVNAPANRLFEHASHWIAGGHQVTVICPAPSAPHGRLYENYENAFWDEEEVDGIRVIRLWTFIAANRGRIRRVLNYVSYMVSSLLALCIVRRHDVLVATTPQFFCGISGAFASVFRKEAFVLEVRDIWPESVEAVGAVRHRFILLFIHKLADFMYSRALRIVTVGEGYRSRLIELGIDEQKLVVIPNGIEAGWIATGGVPNLDIADHRFVVSYVGTLGLAHGLSVLLKAAGQLPEDEYQFLIVGDGAENEMLRREVARLRLRNITFTGLLPRDEVPQILRRSDACLVHLRSHAAFESVLPSKLFESMAAGKPIILGARGYAANLLQEAKAGLVIEPENAGQLTEAIIRLRDDANLRKDLGQNGRTFVMENFQRSRFASDYIKLVLSLVNAPEPQGSEDEVILPNPDSTPRPVRAQSEQAK